MEPELGAGSFLALAIALAGLTLALMHIPRMYLDGALSIGEAVAYGGFVVLLSVGVIVCWGLPIGYVFGGLVCIVTGALPYVQYKLTARTISAYSQREIAKWRKTLAFDPQNAGAHGFLARAYLEIGRIEEAAAELAEAVRMLPRDIEMRKNYELAVQVQRQSRGEPWICPSCRAHNEGNSTACFRCAVRLFRFGPPNCPALDTVAIIVGAAIVLVSALSVLNVLSPQAAVALIGLSAGVLFLTCRARGLGDERE